jgi:multiple sugar transport system substrate-binding protein
MSMVGEKKGERMNRRKFIRNVGVVGAAVVAAAALGYGVSELTRPPPPKPATVPTKPRMRILYQSTYAPALNDWLTARTLEWAAKKGVDVELSTASYLEILPKILTSVEAGNPPDVVFGAGTLIALMAEDPKARHIVPLDDVYNEIGKDDVIEPVKRWYTMDGHIWAIDLFLFVNVVHLIKPFLDEVGRRVEELKTWDDYIEFAREVKKKHPDMYPIGVTLGKTFDGVETWHMFWWPYGGEFMTERSSAGVKYNSQESRETLQRIVDLYNEGLISPDMLQADEFINNNAYLTRKSAFIVEGPTPYYAAVTRNPALAADTLLLPPPAGPKGMFTWGSKQAMCVFAESKNVDLAKDLLVYIFKNRNNYLQFIKSGYYAAYPIFKSVKEQLKKEDPVWARYIEIEHSIVDYTYPLNQPSKAADEVVSKFLFPDAFYKVLIEKKDVDVAITEVDVQIKEIFRRTYGR